MSDESQPTPEGASDSAEVTSMSADAFYGDNTGSLDEGSTEQSTEGDATEGQGQQEIEISLETIAQGLGLDVDYFKVNDKGELLVKALIDGESVDVTPKDLISSYQIRGHLDNKGKEVNKLRAQLTEQQQQHQKQHTEKLQQLDDIYSVAMKELTKEYNDINWNELRDYDHNEWAAKREMFRERYEDIKSKLDGIQQEREANISAQVKTITEQAEKDLIEAFPSWSDPAVGKAEKAKLQEYAATQGFDKQMTEGIIDSRVYKLLEKAQKFDALEASKPDVKQLVRTAVKVTPASKIKGAENKPKSDEELFYGKTA